MSSAVHNPERNRFEIVEEGLTSVAEYILGSGVLVITHVIVPQELRGRGRANLLGAAVIEHAREHGLKVRPLCPFMVAYMKRRPETSDVLEVR